MCQRRLYFKFRMQGKSSLSRLQMCWSLRNVLRVWCWMPGQEPCGYLQMSSRIYRRSIPGNIGLNGTGHMSFLTGQDRTSKFAGQVLPDQKKRENFKKKIQDFFVYLFDVRTFKTKFLFKNISPDSVRSSRTCSANLDVRSCPVRKLIWLSPTAHTR